jgi:hypothetical protein
LIKEFLGYNDISTMIRTALYGAVSKEQREEYARAKAKREKEFKAEQEAKKIELTEKLEQLLADENPFTPPTFSSIHTYVGCIRTLYESEQDPRTQYRITRIEPPFVEVVYLYNNRRFELTGIKTTKLAVGKRLKMGDSVFVVEEKRPGKSIPLLRKITYAEEKQIEDRLAELLRTTPAPEPHIGDVPIEDLIPPEFRHYFAPGSSK